MGSLKLFSGKLKLQIHTYNIYALPKRKTKKVSFSNLENLQDDKFNPLPEMAILGSSNSAANKDMMSKI